MYVDTMHFPNPRLEGWFHNVPLISAHLLSDLSALQDPGSVNAAITMCCARMCHLLNQVSTVHSCAEHVHSCVMLCYHVPYRSLYPLGQYDFTTFRPTQQLDGRNVTVKKVDSNAILLAVAGKTRLFVPVMVTCIARALDFQ